ncbi:hypothetical protein EJ08DRAFT_214296 [Tothia fuscella]|uniref:Uncharacterized protein n=1 Tax=Tothia fuscella TaxID=1048955 RepID=A0A9P4TZ84_9PEZI|nr:hypothetical protein EJ08DRAFT_214296 [Tothia fuscella]
MENYNCWALPIMYRRINRPPLPQFGTSGMFVIAYLRLLYTIALAVVPYMSGALQAFTRAGMEYHALIENFDSRMGAGITLSMILESWLHRSIRSFYFNFKMQYRAEY